MRALNENQRAFVHALVETGGRRAEAAKLAGYECNSPESFRSTADYVMRNAKVQEAILEEGRRQMGGLAIQASQVLAQFIDGSISCPPSTRLRAIEMAMNRIGMHAKTEHEMTITDNRTDGDVVKQIAMLAQQMGMDPKTLLGNQGVTIDADFKIVEAKALPAPKPRLYTGREGLEDLLNHDPL